jgi:hypothetical protein
MKKKVLFEDTVSQYNKWVQGQASREFSAQRLKFKDLFNTHHDLVTQSPNNAKAGNTLPYPIPNAVPILGDLTTSTTNAIRLFQNALKNPAIQDDEHAKTEISTILKYLKNSQQELNNIFKTFENQD